MQHTLSLDVPVMPQPISYKDKLLLTGSCFTEHIAERLSTHRFNVLRNPHGILFNPLSVAETLNSYIDGKQYTANDLFYLNELYNSWSHHTRFSHIDADAALAGINQSQHEASVFIKEASWVVITLGSAFQYYLKDGNRPVANNHRAPAAWFEKRLLEIDVIGKALSETIDKLKAINPNANILFTISPVRHIRDGVVENNRSKARLIEAVHSLTAQYAQAHYFPAYELIIDILRDYRYYDIDYVHPNYLATSFVWEQFVKSCIDPQALPVMKAVQDIATARAHRARFPDTQAHHKFKTEYAAKVRALMAQHPYLCLDDTLNYFSA